MFVLSTGDESLAGELRRLCHQELAPRSNIQLYQDTLETICKEAGVNYKCVETMIVEDDCLRGHSNPFEADCKSSFENGRWSSIHHVMALATILQHSVYLVCEEVQQLSHYRPVLHREFHPVRKGIDRSDTLPNPVRTPIVIFWTCTAGNSIPNHFVPLWEKKGEPKHLLFAKKIFANCSNKQRMVTI